MTGQDGSYLTELLLDKGYEVHGMVRRHSSLIRERLDPIRGKNPKARGYLKLHYGEMSDGASLHLLLDRIRRDEIYNLISQSHVKVSFEQPNCTAEVVANGQQYNVKEFIEEAVQPLGMESNGKEKGLRKWDSWMARSP